MIRSRHGETPEAPALRPFDLWGSPGGWCNQEVSGESHYLDALQALFPAGARNHEVVTRATLVPDPTNRYDANAVAVHVQGRRVGYLPRDVAPAYRQLFEHLARHGFVALVRCQMWGGMFSDFEYDARGGRSVDRFNASVRIGLTQPHLCMPVNAAPQAGYVALPDGGAIQVSGEDQHMPAIEPHLRPQGEAWVYAVVHEIIDPAARVNRERVEVRIDGHRVGQLTPKMSADLLPAIRHLDELGYETVAKAMVKGNRLKAEVVLHCLRAHELPSDWPAESDKVGTPREVVRSEAAETPAPPVVIPPKPTRITFAVPPGWPPVPVGWEPHPEWQPDPSWPRPAVDWQFWVLDHASHPASSDSDASVPAPAVLRDDVTDAVRVQAQALGQSLIDLSIERLSRVCALFIAEAKRSSDERRTEIVSLSERALEEALAIVTRLGEGTVLLSEVESGADQIREIADRLLDALKRDGDSEAE